MKNLLFVLIRTFPFWAVPLSFTLFASARILSKKKRKKGAALLYLLSLISIVMAVLFVVFDWRTMFVEKLYEFFYIMNQP